MKENTKRYVKLSIILYIVILSVALVGPLAWFVYEKSATVKTEDESRIVVGEYLEICFDDHDDDPNNDEWVTDIGVTNVAKFPDVSVTPNGKVWYPVSLNEGDKLLVGDDSQGVYRNVTATPEGYYVRLDLKIRASRGLTVYLHNDSYVRGDMTKTDANVKVDENTEVSFSRDAVAGASRVGFFDENGNAKCVWVPNANYQLLFDEETGDVNGFAQTGAAESEYLYLNVDEASNNRVDEGAEYEKWSSDLIYTGTLAIDGNVNDAKPIVTFTDAGEQKVSLYIWVEGSDREANTVLSGGSISYLLKFVGIDPKVTSNVNIDDVSYDSGKLVYTSSGNEVGGEILYSYDAQSWTPYNTKNPDLTKGNSVLYVRAKETANEQAGEIKEIPIH